MQTLAGVHIRIPPQTSETRSLVALGPERVRGAINVYMWADVLHELMRAASRRPDVMQTAILVGNVCAGPAERFLEVRGYLDLDRYDDALDFARNINEEWTTLVNRAQRFGERMSILGWAAMRADENRLERDLQLAHRSFFNLPYQLLLTINPKSEEVALYGFDETSHLVQVGFQLVVDKA